MVRLVREGPPPGPGSPHYCLDPPGRDVLASAAETAAARCAECKKLATLAARRALDEGHEVDLVFSMGSGVGHVTIRVDGVPQDPSVDAGLEGVPEGINHRAVIVRIR